MTPEEWRRARAEGFSASRALGELLGWTLCGALLVLPFAVWGWSITH